MERNGASFSDALAAAQAEGYAEADPTFDVDGIDAAHKLSILAALCFGTRLDIGAVTADGIRGLIAADWGVTENNRRARYYRLTEPGREHLLQETATWARYAKTVTDILAVPLPAR